MALCQKCGAQVADTAAFCTACGAPMQQQAQPTPDVNGAYQQPNAGANPVNSFVNTADHTAEIHPQDIIDNKIMAILSYFGLLVLIPIFGAKGSKFARFHANQGLVLFLTEIALSIVNGIVTGIVSAIFDTRFYGIVYSVSPVTTIVSLIFSLAYILLFVLAIIGIVNAAQGKAKELPVIGKIKILK